MIVVVTGGCGFVGLNLVHLLASQGGHEIRIVDNLSNGRPENLVLALTAAGRLTDKGGPGGPWTVAGAAGPSQISLEVADVRDEEVASRIARGAQAVVHLAAQTGVQISLAQPREDVTQNVLGTLNYLEACRIQSVERFVVASSMAVVGEAAPPQTEAMPHRPLSPYAASKAAIEDYCTAYYHSFGIKTLALRFANVYGPYAWNKGSVVAAFCKRGLGGKPLVIDGDGMQSRDFVHAGDLAEVISWALGNGHEARNGVFGNALNVASGRQTQVLELARAVQACLGDLDYACDIEFGPPRQVDTRASAPDTALLKRRAPSCKMRGLSEGLPATVRWFRDHWPLERGA